MRDFSTLNDMFLYAAQLQRKEVDFEQPQISASSMEFSVYIDGATWAGRFDPRHARYLLSMQEALDMLLQDVTEGDIIKEPAYVRVGVKGGSSYVTPDIIEFLRPMVANMSSAQTFVLMMTSVAAVAGLIAYSRWLTYKRDSSHEDTIKHAFDTLRAVAENDPARYAPYEKPIRTLAHSLEGEDAVTIDGHGLITAQDLRKALPRKPRSEARTSYADGVYTLRSIDFSNGELVLHLTQDDVQIKALTAELSQEDAARLFDDIKVRTSEEELPFAISLQINVRHTSRVVQYGTVIGFGDPREGKTHVRLSQIIPT